MVSGAHVQGAPELAGICDPVLQPLLEGISSHGVIEEEVTRETAECRMQRVHIAYQLPQKLCVHRGVVLIAPAIGHDRKPKRRTTRPALSGKHPYPKDEEEH